MTLSSKERAALRAQAHHLSATVHVGQQGLTPQLIQSLDDALRTSELVKVQLGRKLDTTVRDAAEALARATDAEVVMTIGKVAVLYRVRDEDEDEGRGTRDAGRGGKR